LSFEQEAAWQSINRSVTTLAKGREEAYPAQEPADGDFDQTQQGRRSVHGRKKVGQEVQRRQAREVMGKLFIALMAVTIALLVGFSVWVIAL
jgi:hypothetical protein